MKLFELFATLELNASKFESGLSKAQSTAGKFAKSVASVVASGASALGHMMTNAATASVKAASSLYKKAMGLAGELEQAVGGSMAVFGVWAEDVQKKSESAYKTMGLSAEEYLATANQMGSLFKGAGFTTVEATDMTTKAMQRAADVASIMGIDAAWAMESIAGAAKGNFTMMDNLGVAINDTTLANYALEKGIKKSVSAMTTQEKIGLAMELFMERTAEYAGNYAKENETLSGSIQTLNAAWSNFLSGADTTDGAALVEAAQNALNVIWTKTKQIVPRLAKSFASMVPSIKRAFTSFWDNDLPGMATSGVNTLIDGINAIFKTNIPKIESIDLPTMEQISEKVSGWWEKARSGVEALCSWTLKLFESPHEAAEDAGKAISGWWNDVGLPGVRKVSQWVLPIFGVPVEDNATIGEIVVAWWKGANSAVAGACSWVLQLFGVPKESAEAIKSTVLDWWNSAVDVVAGACSWVLQLFGVPTETDETILDTVAAWWNGTVGIVAGACSWVLQLFGVPKETAETITGTIKTWWDNTVALVAGACSWVLKLFGMPVETDEKILDTVAAWWKGTVGIVAGACSWVLQLFGVPTETADAITGTIKTWWDNTVDVVVGACSWVLKLFGVPVDTDENITSTMSDWWKGTVDVVAGVCSWVLQLFGVPQETAEAITGTIAAWWKGTVDLVSGACNWVLSLFGVPTESDATIIDTVAAWWNGTVDLVSGACSWVLQLFGVPTETVDNIKSTVSSWWDGAVGAVSGACSWALNLFSSPTETVETIKSKVSSWWDGAVGAVKGACNWILNLPDTPDVDKESADLKSWWADVCKTVGQLTYTVQVKYSTFKSDLEAAAGLVNGTSTVTTDGEHIYVDGKTSETIDALSSPTIAELTGGQYGFIQSRPENVAYGNSRGFAVGLDYVPYDDFSARLHEGEAVLTKQEATAWRRGSDGEGIDYERLASAVASAVAAALSALTVQMDKQTVGSVVSNVVFKEMGRQIKAKQFAT